MQLLLASFSAFVWDLWVVMSGVSRACFDFISIYTIIHYSPWVNWVLGIEMNVILGLLSITTPVPFGAVLPSSLSWGY